MVAYGCARFRTWLQFLTNKSNFMKKIIIVCSLLIFAVSCNEAKDSITEQPVSTEVASYGFQKSFDVVYKASCELLGIPCDETLSLIRKRDIIREADMKDVAGDILPEMPEYDDVRDFVWPDGYGKF